MNIPSLDVSPARLAELVNEAFANLYSQRQRSVLALLGILIGTASIVAMLTIGHMAQLETLKAFRHLGVDMLVHATPAGGGRGVLDRRTIERLPVDDPAVLAATPLVVDRTTVAAGSQSGDMVLAAVTSTLPSLVLLSLPRGRFIAPVDDNSLVAVIGSQAARACRRRARRSSQAAN